MEQGGKVLVVAGEASGDGYAGRMVAALKRLRPGVEVYGVGGASMREAGARVIVDIEQLSTFGIFEIAKKIPALARIFFRVLRSIEEENPSLVVLVDYPDFNIRLAGAIRRRYGKRVKILYYITPQVWIWRKGRAKKLAARADRLAVVFPFEKRLFDGLGAAVDFVGHPLLETIPHNLDREELKRYFKLDPAKRTIALLPGSRHGEIKNYLPPIAEAVKSMERDGSCQFLLARAGSIAEEEIANILSSAGVSIRQVEGETQKVLAVADLAVVALGTATLEAALMGCPAILIGKVQPLTYWFGKKFLDMDLPYYSLVNFILGRKAYPELIQDDMTGEKLARAAGELLASERALAALRSSAGEIQEALWGGERGADTSVVGASARAAAIADQMIT